MENGEFIKLINLLCPGAKVADRRSMGGRLLDQVHLEEIAKVRQQLVGRNVTLAIDCWTTVSSEPVLGMAICCDGLSYLVDSVDTTGHPHTIEYMAALVPPLLNKAEDTFGVKVVAVCTDNASNMKGLREELRKINPVLAVYGCQAHLLNLLSHDLTRDQQPTLAKVLEIFKFLRNNHQAHALLQNMNIPRPLLPAPTLWSTVRDSLAYFNRHWGNLSEICARLLKPGDHLRSFMENVALRRVTEELLLQQEPVAEALAKMQSDEATLADAVEIWLDLLARFRRLSKSNINSPQSAARTAWKTVFFWRPICCTTSSEVAD